jgi:AraC-like DNA-binding protein
MKHFDENRSAFAPYGFTCEIWEAVPMSRPDRHDEIEINFLDKGRLVYLLGGKRVTFEPRTLTMFWAAIPHQIVSFDEVSPYYVVTIPFELFLQWHIPKTMLNRLIMGEVIAEEPGSRTIDDHLLFEQWNHDLSNPTEDMCKIVELEMAARTLRVARSLAPNSSHNELSAETENLLPEEVLEEPANLGKAEMMACFVARNYKTRIQMQHIAEVVNLHPAYASTLFKQTFGTTITALITKHRIADAQRQLLTTDEAIVDIAQAAGFNSLSRFNLAFKQTAGMTPRQYRKQRQWVMPAETAHHSPKKGSVPASVVRQASRRLRASDAS